MPDTWFDRDLPVPKAIVEIADLTGDSTIDVDDIQRRTGFDEATVQRVVKALYSERSLARRRAERPRPPRPGAWPSPETLLERLVEALELATNDDTGPDEERSKFRQAAGWFGSFASRWDDHQWLTLRTDYAPTRVEHVDDLSI